MEPHEDKWRVAWGRKAVLAIVLITLAVQVVVTLVSFKPQDPSFGLGLLLALGITAALGLAFYDGRRWARFLFAFRLYSGAGLSIVEATKAVDGFRILYPIGMAAGYLVLGLLIWHGDIDAFMEYRRRTKAAVDETSNA